MNANQIIKPLTKFRGLIAGVIIIAVLSYTAYLASSIFNVGPDAAYLQEQQKSAQTTSLKVPPDSLQKIKSLQEPGNTNIPIQLGKGDPFSL
jgi:hypothetical protein